MNNELPPSEETPQKGEMSFLQHLEELRWHLIRAAIAIVVCMIAAFIGKDILFGEIILGVNKPDFITYRFLCKVSAILHQQIPALFSEDALCLGQNLPDLVNLTLPGQFTAHIMASLIGGLIMAFPYILWEIWRFIRPALHPSERQHTSGFVFAASSLFMMGVLFGYFVICPLSVNFFTGYQVADMVQNNPTLSSFVSLVTTVILGCGALFQLPILVYFLTRFGLVTPKFLKAYRRHALVGCLVLSAVITPPDIFSQILVSGPLLVLYETSIVISRIVLRRQKKKDEAQYGVQA